MPLEGGDAARQEGDVSLVYRKRPRPAEFNVKVCRRCGTGAFIKVSPRRARPNETYVVCLECARVRCAAYYWRKRLTEYFRTRAVCGATALGIAGGGDAGPSHGFPGAAADRTPHRSRPLPH